MDLTYINLRGFKVSDLGAIRNALGNLPASGGVLALSTDKKSSTKPKKREEALDDDDEDEDAGDGDDDDDSGMKSYTPEEMALLKFMAKVKKPISRSDALEHTSITEETWSEAIASLKKKKAVKQTGKKRAAKYTIKK